MPMPVVQALLHALADQVFLLDPEGHLVSLSSNPKRLAESLEVRFSAEICRMFRSAQAWACQTGQTQIVEYPLPSGRWQEASIHAISNAAGYATILIRDIQRRKEAEIALLRFQAGLTTLNQISFDPQLTRNEQIQQGLALMSQYFQLPYGMLCQFQGQTVQLLNLCLPTAQDQLPLPLQIKSTEPVSQCILEKGPLLALHSLETPIQTPLPEVSAQCLIGMVVYVENQPFGCISFFDTQPYSRSFALQDTEFMRIFARWLGFLLEQDLHIQQLEASIQNKDRIMEIIAHDLRNPIGAVIGLGEFSLKINGQDDSQLNQAIRGMVSAAKRANQLLSVMLNADQLESGKQQMHPLLLNLSHLVQQIATEHADQARKKKIQLSQQIHPHAHAMLDVSWFSLALENLFSNALKYTPEAGLIQIELEARETVWELRVRDTGIGIPPALQARIFDKFTTAKRPGLAYEMGTGLGLHLTRQIIQRHGGEIWLESQVDLGSCFYIHLPRHRPPPTET